MGPFSNLTRNRTSSSSKRVLFGPAYQPSIDHSFGDCFFGTDGLLYVSTGDGGPQFDPDNNSQNRSLPFGKILRLDPSAPAPYIPSTNPWVLDPTGLDAVLAHGLRMPWRMTLDALTGDFYLSDVGQTTVEEVNVLPFNQLSAKNFGWRCREGDQCTPYGGCNCSDPNLVEPALAYTHTEGRCAVIGGHVYRGADLPWLDGRYFYTDFCKPEVQSFRWDGSAAVDLTTHSSEIEGWAALEAPSSFGVDARGEILITDIRGELYRLEPLLPEPWPQFCFGDGACVQCPCNNNEAPGVQAGCRNAAQNLGASLSVQGQPSLTSQGLRFDLRHAAPQSFAILLSAANRLPVLPSGPCLPGTGLDSPVLDGLRCIGGGLTRHGVLPTDAQGAVGLTNSPWEGTPGQPFGASHGFVPGQVRHFQVFYRVDPASGCGTGQGTTQGLSQIFVP